MSHQVLVHQHPALDSGVGRCYLAGLYNVAPWPIGSKGKAAKYLDEGARRAPTRRNLYYVGVVSYQSGDYRKAADHFQRAIATPVSREPSSTEADIADFLLERARRGLKAAQEAIAAEP